MTIRGEILFEGEIVNITGSAVYVRLEDVSRQDAVSVLISEYLIDSLPEGFNTSNKIPFQLEGNINDLKAYYNIRVHVDVDRDGKISVGDYITMESFPINLTDPTKYYFIKVRRV